MLSVQNTKYFMKITMHCTALYMKYDNTSIIIIIITRLMTHVKVCDL